MMFETRRSNGLDRILECYGVGYLGLSWIGGSANREGFPLLLALTHPRAEELEQRCAASYRSEHFSN